MIKFKYQFFDFGWCYGVGLRVGAYRTAQILEAPAQDQKPSLKRIIHARLLCRERLKQRLKNSRRIKEELKRPAKAGFFMPRFRQNRRRVSGV